MCWDDDPEALVLLQENDPLGDDEKRSMYLGLKANRSGIWPMGLAFHTGRKDPSGVRVYGLQVGLLVCSFWLGMRTGV